MSQSLRVLCLSEAVSPITHMSRASGNESIVARQPVLTPDGSVAWVPFLSGNAIRHRAVREPGVRYLVLRYGLQGKLTLTQLNYLFHGGNLTEGGGREDTGRVAAMQTLFPLLRLLGGSLPDQIIAGSLLPSHGVLVCRENVRVLQAMLPTASAGCQEDWSLPALTLRSAEDFVSGYQYTRGDAKKSAADLLPPASPDAAPEATNLMIFAGQAVTTGAYFLHDFVLRHANPLELGALLWSLTLWQHAGGTIGGQAARGHGRMRTAIHVDGADAESAIGAYLAHVDAVAQDAVAWLDSAFGKRPSREKAEKAEKGEKGAKGAKPDAEPSETIDASEAGKTARRGRGRPRKEAQASLPEPAPVEPETFFGVQDGEGGDPT